MTLPGGARAHITCSPTQKERPVLALSSRTGTDPQGRKRVAFGPFSKRCVNGRNLRATAVRADVSRIRRLRLVHWRTLPPIAPLSQQLRRSVSTNFNAARMPPGNLTALKKVNVYEQATFAEKGGWAVDARKQFGRFRRAASLRLSAEQLEVSLRGSPRADITNPILSSRGRPRHALACPTDLDRPRHVIKCDRVKAPGRSSAFYPSYAA
jgi:hypothetical protein